MLDGIADGDGGRIVGVLAIGRIVTAGAAGIKVFLSFFAGRVEAGATFLLTGLRRSRTDIGMRGGTLEA